MRVRLLLLTLCALLLAGCQAKETPSSESEGDNSASQSEPAPSPKTLQELLEEQPIDDTHDAFLVDTGGRMGTLLVTTELVPYEEPSELFYHQQFSIWDPANPAQPIQIQEIDLETVHYGYYQVLDVNFDGYQDFTYLFAMGVQVELYHCMIWDEELGRFVEEPVYAEIPSPNVDPETETISGWSRNSAASDGTTPIYKWIDGELTCVRKIETFRKEWNADSPMVLTVEDRIDGELTEVFRTEFPAGSEEHIWERIKWEDLNYHGETE